MKINDAHSANSVVSRCRTCGGPLKDCDCHDDQDGPESAISEQGSQG